MVDLLNILRREREFCLAVKNSGILGVFDGSIALPSQKYFIEAILSETMEGNPRPSPEISSTESWKPELHRRRLY